MSLHLVGETPVNKINSKLHSLIENENCYGKNKAGKGLGRTVGGQSWQLGTGNFIPFSMRNSTALFFAHFIYIAFCMSFCMAS